MSTYNKQYKRNKQGFIVVADGRSNVSNPDGRPATKRKVAFKHIQKMYSGKTFSSQDIMRSYRGQLQGESPLNVKAGMLLRSLEKHDMIQCVGIKANGQRGNNIKLYQIK